LPRRSIAIPAAHNSDNAPLLKLLDPLAEEANLQFSGEICKLVSLLRAAIAKGVFPEDRGPRPEIAKMERA
jgi:hypothetical protein